jgi:molybdate transport system substrate-binding protein
MRLRLLLLLLLLLLPLSAASADAKKEKKKTETVGITVLASTSLTDALTEVSRVYAKEKGVTVSMFFDAPAELADSITRGESADIYISELTDAFTSLKQQGLIDVYTLTNIARNRMVLCVPSDSHLLRQVKPPVPLEKILPKLSERVILVLPDTEKVPLGMYAKGVFQQMGYWGSIKSVLLRAETDRRALYLVAKGKNAGVLFASDAMNNPEVTVISYFPEKSHPPIIYQGAVVAGTNMALAREFLDFLKTRDAQKVFRKYGFLEP